ncbi:MAG: type II secretion system protein M [Gammaproteobacteria bacterium]|nr:type II secretion system protein M [Gammaproteobacteria bacterium]
MNLSDVSEKYQQLTTREKVLVLVTGLVVIVMLSFFLVVEPQLNSWQKQLKINTSLMQKIKRTQTQIRDIELALSKEMNGELKQQIVRLKGQQQSIKSKLINQELALVAKTEMVTVLKSLLKENNQLKLMGFGSTPPQPILFTIPNSTSKESEQATPLLYKHIVKVEVEGGYFSILRFLQQIERSNSSILWGSINYSVAEYPKANATVKVFTLSTDKEFIGVNK